VISRHHPYTDLHHTHFSRRQICLFLYRTPIKYSTFGFPCQAAVGNTHYCITFLNHRHHLQIYLRTLGLQPNQKSLTFSPTVPITSNPTPISYYPVPTWLLEYRNMFIRFHFPQSRISLNLSLISGQFVSSFSRAIINHVFPSQETHPGQRPVIQPPYIQPLSRSKTIERVVKSRLTDY